MAKKNIFLESLFSWQILFYGVFTQSSSCWYRFRCITQSRVRSVLAADFPVLASATSLALAWSRPWAEFRWTAWKLNKRRFLCGSSTINLSAGYKECSYLLSLRIITWIKIEITRWMTATPQYGHSCLTGWWTLRMWRSREWRTGKKCPQSGHSYLKNCKHEVVKKYQIEHSLHLWWGSNNSHFFNRTVQHGYNELNLTVSICSLCEYECSQVGQKNR